MNEKIDPEKLIKEQVEPILLDLVEEFWDEGNNAQIGMIGPPITKRPSPPRRIPNQRPEPPHRRSITVLGRYQTVTVSVVYSIGEGRLILVVDTLFGKPENPIRIELCDIQTELADTIRGLVKKNI